MAIITKQDREKGNMDNSNSDSKKKEPKVVDPQLLLKGDSSLPKGESRKLDSTQANDAWSFGAPPDKGRYDLRPSLGKDGLSVDETDPTEPHYLFSIESRIVSDDKDVDNIPVFSYLSTKIGRGKDISTAAAFLVKLGFKLPNEANDLTIAQMLLTALKKEKVLRSNLVDWKTGYRDPKNDRWVNVFSSQENFPKDGDGTYKHKFTHTQSGNELTAQLYVAEWGDVKAENVKVDKSSNSTTKTPSVAPVKITKPTPINEVKEVKEEVSEDVQDDLQFALEEE